MKWVIRIVCIVLILAFLGMAFVGFIAEIVPEKEKPHIDPLMTDVVSFQYKCQMVIPFDGSGAKMICGTYYNLGEREFVIVPETGQSQMVSIVQ